MSAQSKSYKKLAGVTAVIIVVVFLIVLFLPIISVTYEVTVPEQKTEENVLINDKPTVPAGKYLYYYVYIDISGKENNKVCGTITETAGYDINFYVFDQKGFNAWKEKISAPAYVSAARVNNYSYCFAPDHSDYYYFVLDNTYSWFTNKVPQITASWTYQTTYMKIVNETKYVSLIQLLTGTK